MTITATGAASSAHTISYSAAQPALGLTALSPAATPAPGSYTVATGATSGVGSSVRIQLSVNRAHTRLHTLPSTIPAAVDPLGPASASQTSYRPTARRAQPAMRFPA